MDTLQYITIECWGLWEHGQEENIKSLSGMVDAGKIDLEWWSVVSRGQEIILTLDEILWPLTERVVQAPVRIDMRILES